MSRPVEREADEIDCALARVESRLDRLDPQRTAAERKEAYAAASYVRMARAQVRLLMSAADREATKW
jgi:hypothetical protein